MYYISTYGCAIHEPAEGHEVSSVYTMLGATAQMDRHTALRERIARIGGGAIGASLAAAATFLPLSGDLERDAEGNAVYVYRSLVGLRLVSPDLPFAILIFALVRVGGYLTFLRR